MRQYCKIPKFFQKLKFFMTVSFLIWKDNLIVIDLRKKIIEIGPTVLEISCFEEKKNHRKLDSESLFNNNYCTFFQFFLFYCNVGWIKNLLTLFVLTNRVLTFLIIMLPRLLSDVKSQPRVLIFKRNSCHEFCLI